MRCSLGESVPSLVVVLKSILGMDVAVLTYYPLNADFTVQAVSVVAGDFALMASALTGKRLGALISHGYESAARVGQQSAGLRAFLCHNHLKVQ